MRFIDSIKLSQDAFLPHVEDGTIILIGATTENPGFYVNAPLISRTQVYKLEKLSSPDIKQIIQKAIKEYPDHKWNKKALEHINTYADGDARACINAISLAASLSKDVTIQVAEAAVQKKALYYDKKGDSHYDTISAFIKSMRGGDPNATLHYLARMITAGEDPMFIARRMVIFASEDVGNARPAALVLATSCMQAVRMVGMPEAQLILAQTATYLATAEKSIASTVGIFRALDDVQKMPIDPIPLHLRNPANKVMKGFDYGKGHVRYPWQQEKKTGKKVKQDYLPKNLRGKKYYEKDDKFE